MNYKCGFIAGQNKKITGKDYYLLKTFFPLSWIRK